MKRTLCAAGLAALCLTWSAPGAAQPVADHLKCYKVKDPQKKTTYTAALGGLVAEPGCKIKVPAQMACVPSTKTNVTPPPPGGGGTGTPNTFFCYKVKCAKATLPTLTGADQFGGRTVTPSAAKLLCAPLAGPPTTTTTTASTTTTTMAATCSLPATGQTACWNSSGTFIPCAGTGQDGDLQEGAPLTYVDNGDGTITDVNTALVWEKESSDGSVHDKNNTSAWDQAFSGHVLTLNATRFAGHKDWRVPNERELQSLVDFARSYPTIHPAFDSSCQPGCTIAMCSCTTQGFYWSSTSIGTTAWIVSFADSSVGTIDKNASRACVRAVRGGSVKQPTMTTTTTLPDTCQFDDHCGSSCAGQGRCLAHLPDVALECVNTGSCVVTSCSSDTNCPSGSSCLSDGSATVCCSSLCP